jgi:hypothetical protein
MQHKRLDMAKNSKTRDPLPVELASITEVQVAGFKSISEEQRIEIRPLTILAGANSSGKSSIMQPVLLLKQTLEASYDAGPIFSYGPILKFTLADQLLSRIGKHPTSGTFQVGMRVSTGDHFHTTFRKEHRLAFGIERTEINWWSNELVFWPEMTHDEIVNAFRDGMIDPSTVVPQGYSEGRWAIARDRCFIAPVWGAKRANGTSLAVGVRPPGPAWEEVIPRIIHVPGLRGNIERTFSVTSVGPTFPGTFEKYIASVVSQWVVERAVALDALNADLKLLGLTGGVTAVAVNDLQLELHVGRLPDVPPTRKDDRVHLAEVGLGVSQTLPILVALHAANPGTLVHVEQPETHLHPQAQFLLAQVLAAAAKRGVRVVVETHSTMLLLGVQTLVAEEKLDANMVKLHWFKRDKAGRTTVESADLDETGAFGEWPQDFDDVTLKDQKRYLDAADKRMFAR